MQNNVRFKVYKKQIDINGVATVRHLIALYDGDFLVNWTNFHEYITIGKYKRVVDITCNAGMRPYNVCKFLNYVFFDEYHVKKLTEITVEMIESFLNSYGMCKLPNDKPSTHRQETTVELCVNHITDFALELLRKHGNEMKFSKKDLVIKYKQFNKHTNTYDELEKPIFTVYCKPSQTTIFRDIPDKAFKIIMNKIKTNHPNILMIASLGAYAGLRPSECCNVRRTDSPLGAGIKFDTYNGDVVDVRIDLLHERKLRSDEVFVGGIKKPRTQRVFEPFIDEFCNNYNLYTQYIKGKKYETNYGALTNNRNGKAITYNSYFYEFKKVVKECIPEFLNSNDPQLVFYGRELQNGQTIAPHIFRHWFSVQLTLGGASDAELMYWRGDKSVESALAYLKNKGDLQKKYKLVHNATFSSLYNAAERKFTEK